MSRKLALPEISTLPQINYFLPEWEILVEYDQKLRKKALRPSSPIPSHAVVSFWKGAIDLVTTYGPHKLYEAMTQMKFAWMLYENQGKPQLII